MSLKFKILFIAISIYLLYMVKSSEAAGDELTLRNQLFTDVYLIKEGVDRLQISVEVLNKRYNNQVEVLKGIEERSSTNDDQDNCIKIGTLINTTNRKLNAFELQILTRLEQIQDEQATLMEYVKLKGNSTKSCATVDTTGILDTMSPIITGLNKKVDEFAQKLTKLETMEEMFKLQQTKLEQFNHDQMKMLQEINMKLTKNQEQFETFEREMPNITNMLTKMNQVTHKEPTKLPMAYLLGLTSANITKS